MSSTSHAVFCRGGSSQGGVWPGGGWGGGGLGKGGGGRGHFGPAAIYCITTWCFALKGLRTITSGWPSCMFEIPSLRLSTNTGQVRFGEFAVANHTDGMKPGLLPPNEPGPKFGEKTFAGFVCLVSGRTQQIVTEACGLSSFQTLI